MKTVKNECCFPQPANEQFYLYIEPENDYNSGMVPR